MKLSPLFFFGFEFRVCAILAIYLYISLIALAQSTQPPTSQPATQGNFFNLPADSINKYCKTRTAKQGK